MPKMLQPIAVYYFMGPERAVDVGDQDKDQRAAERAGVRFEWARELFGWFRPSS